MVDRGAFRGLGGELNIRRQRPSCVKTILRAGAVLAALALTACQALDDPHAPWSVQRATQEGVIVVYANNKLADPAIAGFERRYPGIRVRWEEHPAAVLHDAILRNAAIGPERADIVWSTAMDMQVKLINDGYAQPCRCPAAKGLPDWAVWRDRGFGLTFQSVGFAYNTRLLPEAEAPRSHAALLAAMRQDPARWRRRVALYGPEASGLGFLYLSADLQAYPEAWDLLGAVARSDPAREVAGEALMNQLTAGERLLAYNATRSYAEWWRTHRDPAIRFVTPQDYHLIIPTVAFVTRDAPHPTAARLFLDFLMSPEGQDLLRQERLTPITDWAREANAPGAHPIRVGPSLLANVDQARRAQILGTWRERLAGDPP